MCKAFLLFRRLLLYLRLLQTRQSGICVKPSFYPGGFCFIYVFFRRGSREYMRFVLFTFSSGIVRREYMLRIVNPSFYPGGFCFIYVYFRRDSREYMRFVLFTFSSGVVRREYMLRIVKPSFYPGGFCFFYVYFRRGSREYV